VAVGQTRRAAHLCQGVPTTTGEAESNRSRQGLPGVHEASCDVGLRSEAAALSRLDNGLGLPDSHNGKQARAPTAARDVQCRRSRALRHTASMPCANRPALTGPGPSCVPRMCRGPSCLGGYDCWRTSTRVGETTLGPVALGQTQARARQTLPRFRVRSLLSNGTVSTDVGGGES
jgi:hypothetical protein